MEVGSIFCFRSTALGTEPFGPMHTGLAQAKAWARRLTLVPGEVIGFAEVRAFGTAKVKTIDLDFGADEKAPEPTAGDPATA